MALNLQTVLGTDSVETMRIITNDNFSLVANLLNQYNNYFDSNFGTITNLSNVETNELRVNTNKLVITPSLFNINANVDVIGSINLNGNLINSNINPTIITSQLQEVIDNGGVYNLESTSSYPTFSTYLVTSSASTGLTIDLFPGANGQEILLVMTNDPSGTETFVAIRKSSSGTAELYLPSGKNYIVLNEIGQTVKLKYINDGWYIIGGNGYSFN